MQTIHLEMMTVDGLDDAFDYQSYIRERLTRDAFERIPEKLQSGEWARVRYDLSDHATGSMHLGPRGRLHCIDVQLASLERPLIPPVQREVTAMRAAMREMVEFFRYKAAANESITKQHLLDWADFLEKHTGVQNAQSV